MTKKLQAWYNRLKEIRDEQFRQARREKEREGGRVKQKAKESRIHRNALHNKVRLTRLTDLQEGKKLKLKIGV